ncbi:MAG TPA: OmpA family protein [Firmicutes bacterium]|nr:OmpA family protein [Bacillota bacterium]
MKKLSFVFVMLLSLAVLCSANITGSYLNIGIPGRSVAMGEAYTAVNGDINSLFFNPSGIVGIEDHSFFMSRNIWFEGITQDSIGYAGNFGFGVLGVGLVMLDYGDDIPGYDALGNSIGNLKANNMVVNLNYANTFGPKLSYGVRYRYVKETLADETASASLLGLGLGYELSKAFYLGLDIENIGQEMKFIESGDEFPRTVKLGVCYHHQFSYDHGLLASFDINNDAYESLRGGLGLEYGFRNMYFIRTGYKINYDLYGLTFGAGINFPILNRVRISVDYAFQDMDIMGDTHRISIAFSPTHPAIIPIPEPEPVPYTPEPMPVPEPWFVELEPVQVEVLTVEDLVQKKTGLPEFQVMFKPDGYDIDEENSIGLGKLIKTILEQPNKAILIEGHTDWKLSGDYNQRLSEQRAESIKDYFVSKGVPSARIFTIGYGEMKPIAPNETEEGRAKNRRVEVYLITVN